MFAVTVPVVNVILKIIAYSIVPPPVATTDGAAPEPNMPTRNLSEAEPVQVKALVMVYVLFDVNSRLTGAVTFSVAIVVPLPLKIKAKPVVAAAIVTILKLLPPPANVLGTDGDVAENRMVDPLAFSVKLVTVEQSNGEPFDDVERVHVPSPIFRVLVPVPVIDRVLEIVMLLSFVAKSNVPVKAPIVREVTANVA